MLKISEFFKKIQGKHAQKLLVHSIVSTTTKKYAHFDVLVENIDISYNTAVLKGLTAMQRSQIFIKKQAILTEINSLQSIQTIVNIR